MEGKWISKPNNQNCIVFIHGIMSDSTKCWTNANGSHWPTFAAADPALAEIGVYNFSFKTGPTSRDYGIGDAVDSLKENFRLDGLFEFSTIIFACHSLGGIIARKFAVENARSLETKNIGFFLLGSPSYGSILANVLSPLARLMGHSQAAALLHIDANPWLADLDRTFKNLKDQPHIKIFGKELTEDLPFPGILRKIVTQNSASAYFGDSYKVPDTDHSTLVKPSGEGSIQHKMLRDFALSRAQKNLQPSSQTSQSIRGTTGDPLFEIYSAKNRNYYIERDIDKKVSKAAKATSLWIYGSSGGGKTSIVRRLLEVEKIRFIEISLAVPSNNATNSILREISETIAIQTNTPSATTPTMSTTLDSILAHGNGSALIVFLDEVPVGNSSQGAETLQVIAGLQDGIKRRNSENIQLIVCSISKPAAESSKRFFEQFGIIETPRWLDDELLSLILRITEALPSLSLVAEDLQTIIKESDGSPRFVKAFFRELRDAQSVPLALEATKKLLAGI